MREYFNSVKNYVLLMYIPFKIRVEYLVDKNLSYNMFEVCYTCSLMLFLSHFQIPNDNACAMHVAFPRKSQ